MRRYTVTETCLSVGATESGGEGKLETIAMRLELIFTLGKWIPNLAQYSKF